LMDSLRQRRLRHALVCDDHQKLLGLVSRTDLIGKDQCRAHEVMTRRPKTVEPDMMLNPAITLLLTSGLTCLPVVNEDDQPVGMLSVFELVLALQCTLMSLQTMASQNELSTKVVRSRTISEIVALQQSEA
jgi:acetoin utilization protein AcuB